MHSARAPRTTPTEAAAAFPPSRRVPRLRTHLVALALVVLLPMLAFAAIASWATLRSARDASEARLLETARALSAALDNVITAHVAALTALAAAPDAQPGGDLERLRVQAAITGAALGSAVIVFAPDGAQLLNTQVPPGAPLPGAGAPLGSLAANGLRRVVETGEPLVSDVAVGRVSRRPQAVAYVPVLRDGRVERVIGMTLLPERLGAVLAAGRDPLGAGAAALTDGQGVIAARSRDGERVIGQVRPPGTPAASLGESGLLRGRSLVDGAPIRTAYHVVSRAPGWMVWVNEPEAAFSAAWRDWLAALTMGAVLALLAGFTGAALLSRRLLRPVQALVRHAEAVADGRATAGDARALGPAGVAEFDRLREALLDAEAALRAGEARLRRVQRIGRVGGFEIDLRSGSNWRSAEYMALHGRRAMTAQEAHEDWVQRLHPEDRPRAEARYLAAIADGAPDTEYAQEYRVVTPDGAVRWIAARAEIERDAGGRAVRVVGAHVDVTALKSVEAALRMALDAGQVGTFDWNPVTGELAWDARLRAIWGLPPGMPVSLETFFAGLHPDDVARMERVIAAATDPAGDGVLRTEYRIIGLTDGVERHVSAKGRTEFAEGRAVRMIGTAIDVTPLRHAAEVLAREAEQLQRLAERRGKALAESEARLVEATRMEALGRLAGGIAHDINNVLQAVQGGLRLAARRLAEDPVAARRYLGLAGDAAARGADITGRLLSFARRGELRAEPVAPAPLLEGLAEMLRHTLGPQIAIRVEAAPGLPPVLADRSQLEAVLVNLANNARDAMRGGGALRLRAELPEEAPPAGLTPGTCLRLSVIDEGAGMPAEVLARVTEPFFTTKPRGQGTGLGLAMARGFAEQSGGRLAIESELGRGTTVSLWLPKAPEQAAPGPLQEDRPAEGPGRRLTVLLAEDQAEIRDLLGEELEESGLSVARAPDGGVAIALLDGGLRPDVLVTDFAMPGPFDGLALAEEARRRLPRLAVVLVTGHVGDAATERLEAVERGGPFAVVRKPVAPELLLDCLARVLGPAYVAASRPGAVRSAARAGS
jgi:signal transduction histidine kinase